MNPFILVGIAFVAFGVFQDFSKKSVKEPPKNEEKPVIPAVNPVEKPKEKE